MAKLSSVFMEAAYSRKRKRNQRPKQKNRQKKHKGFDCDLSPYKQNSSCNKLQGLDYDDLSAKKTTLNYNNGIDKLSEDVLIAILSRLSLKQAARTSVLSRRWRYLWTSAVTALEFKDRDIATGAVIMKRAKFRSWVSSVLKAYQSQPNNSIMQSLIIRFFNTSNQSCPLSSRTRRALDSWVHFAMQKESVQRFELDLSPFSSCYDFPNVDKLSSQMHCLRSLSLVSVSIKDEVVNHILATCPHLEHLCINLSDCTNNLRVVDPLPNLKALEIITCPHIRSVEISCASLVSLAFHGGKNVLKLLETPNLRELNLGRDLSNSLVFEPNQEQQYSSYLVQIVKLVLDHRVRSLHGRAKIVAHPDLPQFCSLKRLELEVNTVVGRSLLFFTTLIKASPVLHEFRIKLIYLECWIMMLTEMIVFPRVSAAKAVKFEHNSLKVVEIGGYVGCSSERKLLLHLIQSCPSLERILIDTESHYYDDTHITSLIAVKKMVEGGGTSSMEIGATTRTESKERAQHLLDTLPCQEINFIIV